jgi:hypothetical protein
MFDFSRDLLGLSLEGVKLDGAFDRMKATLSYQNYQEDGDRIRSNNQRNIDGFDVDTWGLACAVRQEGRRPHADVRNGLVPGFGGFVALQLRRKRHPEFGGHSRPRWRTTPRTTSAGSSCRTMGPEPFALPHRRTARHLRRRRCGPRRLRRRRPPPCRSPWKTIGSPWWARRAPSRNSATTARSTAACRRDSGSPDLRHLTRLDIARTNEFEVPSPGLDPEHANTFEVGVKGRGEIAFDVAYYYTLLDDIIIRRPTGVVTGGFTEAVKSNDGDGFVQGVDVAGRWIMNDHWSPAHDRNVDGRRVGSDARRRLRW